VFDFIKYSFSLSLSRHISTNKRKKYSYLASDKDNEVWMVDDAVKIILKRYNTERKRDMEGCEST